MADPSFFERIDGWVTGGVAALVAWVWNSTHKKIADQGVDIKNLQTEVHTKVVRKDDFKEYVDRAESSRSELSNAINTVNLKVDQILVMLANHSNHGDKS